MLKRKSLTQSSPLAAPGRDLGRGNKARNWVHYCPIRANGSTWLRDTQYNGTDSNLRKNAPQRPASLKVLKRRRVFAEFEQVLDKVDRAACFESQGFPSPPLVSGTYGSALRNLPVLRTQ
jgi:hypothetical protein